MARFGRGYPIQHLQAPRLAWVAYDATGAGANASAASLSWSHTISGNAVVAWFSAAVDSSTASATAQVGTTAMTQLASLINIANASGVYLHMFAFGLLNPPTGSQTITASTSSGTTRYLAANSVSYFRVSSFGTPATTTGTGTTASQSVTSTPGRTVAQAFTDIAAAPGSFSAYSPTQRSNIAAVSGTNKALVIGDGPGAATVNFSATQPSSAYGGIAVPLIP